MRALAAAEPTVAAMNEERDDEMGELGGSSGADWPEVSGPFAAPLFEVLTDGLRVELRMPKDGELLCPQCVRDIEDGWQPVPARPLDPVEAALAAELADVADDGLTASLEAADAAEDPDAGRHRCSEEFTVPLWILTETRCADQLSARVESAGPGDDDSGDCRCGAVPLSAALAVLPAACWPQAVATHQRLLMSARAAALLTPGGHPVADRLEAAASSLSAQLRDLTGLRSDGTAGPARAV